MHVIIELGGSQYKVAEGDTIEAHRLSDKEGKTITLDKVMLFSDGKKVQIGQPFLTNIKVTAKVVQHRLAEKVIAFKFRRRKNYARKRGHRQQTTTLNITKITPE